MKNQNFHKNVMKYVRCEMSSFPTLSGRQSSFNDVFVDFGDRYHFEVNELLKSNEKKWDFSFWKSFAC